MANPVFPFPLGREAHEFPPLVQFLNENRPEGSGYVLAIVMSATRILFKSESSDIEIDAPIELLEPLVAERKWDVARAELNHRRQNYLREIYDELFTPSTDPMTRHLNALRSLVTQLREDEIDTIAFGDPKQALEFGSFFVLKSIATPGGAQLCFKEIYTGGGLGSGLYVGIDSTIRRIELIAVDLLHRLEERLTRRRALFRRSSSGTSDGKTPTLADLSFYAVPPTE